MATTDHKADPPAQQRATAGIGMMGKPATVEAVPLEPTLPPDIDPVLLVRLYPGATTAGELRTQAMAAGHAVQEQGALLEAEQQEQPDMPPTTPPPPHPALEPSTPPHQPPDKK
jgi:hypothetical protein